MRRSLIVGTALFTVLGFSLSANSVRCADSHVLPEAQPGVRAAVSILSQKYSSKMNPDAFKEALSAAENTLNDAAYASKLRIREREEGAGGAVSAATKSESGSAHQKLRMETSQLMLMLIQSSGGEIALDFMDDVNKQGIAQGLIDRGGPVVAVTTAQPKKQPASVSSSVTLSNYAGLSAHADGLPADKVEAKNRFYHLAMQAAIKIAQNDDSMSKRAAAKNFLKSLSGKFKALHDKLPAGAREMCGMDVQICLAIANG
jgi:hypothetical protein